MTIASKKFFSYIEHEEDTGFVFKDTKTIDIPPLFAQPGNKLQGWNAKNIESYLALLFSLLGAVRGGDVDLSDKTKKIRSRSGFPPRWTIESLSVLLMPQRTTTSI